MSTNDAPRTERRIHLEKAQAKRDADDKRSRDVADARQRELEIDAAKTARLRNQRLAENAADQAAAPLPANPAPPRSNSVTSIDSECGRPGCERLRRTAL
jgi:hypothetical protein